MTTEKKQEINWTPIVIGGTVVGGLYLVWRLLQTLTGETEADRELAREIMADWQDEFGQLQTYTETIYYGGRTPTDTELSIISAMIDQMSLKEQTIYNLSISVWKEFEDVVAEIAAALWLTSKAVALMVISGIAGYVTVKIVKEWKNRRGPPPNFPCPRCGQVFGTEGALKHHFDTTHQVSLDAAAEAQVKFYTLQTWIQGSIAVESLYKGTFRNWRTYNTQELKAVTWGIASAWVYGIASAAQASILQTMVLALVI